MLIPSRANKCPFLTISGCRVAVFRFGEGYGRVLERADLFSPNRLTRFTLFFLPTCFTLKGSTSSLNVHDGNTEVCAITILHTVYCLAEAPRVCEATRGLGSFRNLPCQHDCSAWWRHCCRVGFLLSVLRSCGV